MKLHKPSAVIFIPDGKPLAEALPRITHLGIGAHQDDLEFMAFHGISPASPARTAGSAASPAPTAPAVRAAALMRVSPTST
jgi:hypothetical protein